MGVFFPEMFEIVNIDNSSIINNTWVNIGIGYDSTFNAYLFYQNGNLIYSSYNRRYASLISNNPRLSLTIGGAYLNDSIINKPDNFEQMKCFARLPIFNYTNMYGNIDYLTLEARLLTAAEFAADADPTNTNIEIYNDISILFELEDRETQTTKGNQTFPFINFNRFCNFNVLIY